MKKFVTTMMLIGILSVCLHTQVVAQDVVTKKVSELPENAREMLSKYFPYAKISYIKVDKDLFLTTSYDVKLSDGTEIDFNSKGDWLEIDCQKEVVPAALIPESIRKYMEENFKGQRITEIERNRKGYQITLANDLEIKFDPFGTFIKLDL